MADIDKFSEINENFNTIKTLLNSIRAQGILNTSDVDKLLTGINGKLEKINTEEDIDLIKVFLSELKQNLDERHNVLLSKFGAIESLFSNMLKNSSEMLKSSEVKELFDIVATNLSVFSREVLSQKESLSDITLRLDALRSDDSQKKDIIKNISLLKNDLERLNNGFDSIVLSLNDNFKTIIKTIASYDKTDYLDKFADVLSNIEMSSNTVLSALQMLDKKTSQVEASLDNLASREDIFAQSEQLHNLSAQNKELAASVSELSGRYMRFDSLAEKIDASVNIIASLKSVLAEERDLNTQNILDEFNKLQAEVLEIKSDEKFEEFKVSLESMLRNIAEGTLNLNKNLNDSFNEIQKVADIIKGLDISVSFQDLVSNLGKVELNLKTHVDDSTEKISSLHEVNITRVLNSISSSADVLGSKLNETQLSVAEMCERNFSAVFENVTDLKNTIRQLDESCVSSNNAILSNITDRLTFFENSLRASIETQEKTVSSYSAQLSDQVENIKNLAGVLDYKIDSSVVEAGSVKKEFSELKTAVENVLALDFVNTVKDLKVDLYAAKQDISNSIEGSSNTLSEKVSNDLYSKYELLISKLDNVEDEFKKAQAASLAGIKPVLDNISSSIVDVLSYVSVQAPANTENLDAKLSGFSDAIKENSISYIESVRDVVDVIRVQVEASLKEIQAESSNGIAAVTRTITENSEALKGEIKNAYSKLLEIQESYNEIRDFLSINTLTSGNRVDGILDSADGIKLDFDTKLAELKRVLLDKISDYKQDFASENTDRISELRTLVESAHSNNSQEVLELVEEIKLLINRLTEENSSGMAGILAKILENFVSLKSLMNTLNDKYTESLSQKVDVILEDFASLKSVLDKVDENVDGDMTRQLSIIESNFESLVSQITILFDKSDKSLAERIETEFSSVSDKMQGVVSAKLEEYKSIIEKTFDSLQAKNDSQSEFLKDKISDINNAMKSIWAEQSDENMKQLDEIAASLKAVIDENVKLTAVDYCSLKTKLNEFAQNIAANNQSLTQDLKAQLDDITKYIDSVLEIQAQETAVKHEELNTNIKNMALDVENAVSSSISVADLNFKQVKNVLSENFAGIKDGLKTITDENTKKASETVMALQNLNNHFDEDLRDLTTSFDKGISSVSSGLRVLSDDTGAKLTRIESSVEGLKNNIDAKEDSLQSSISSGFNAVQTGMKDISDLNTARLVDLSASITEVKSVLEDQYNSAKTSAADISVLTHMAANNGVMIETLSNRSEEQHEDVLLHSQNIMDAVKGVDNTLNERSSGVLQQGKNILDAIKFADSRAIERNDILTKQAKALLNAMQISDGITKEHHEKLLLQGNNILDAVKITSNILSEQNREILQRENNIIDAVKVSNDVLTEKSELVAKQGNDILDAIKIVDGNIKEQLSYSNSTKTDLINLSNQIDSSKSLILALENSLNEKVGSLLATSAEISAGELQSIDAYVNNLSEQIEAEKQNVIACKEMLIEFLNKELGTLSQNIEKETDVIIGELLDQFEILKRSQADETVKLTSQIEDIVSSQIYNNIEDLKSFFDIKTDTSVMLGKLDNLKVEMTDSVEKLLSNLNKLLDANVFKSDMADYKVALELLINSSVETLNDKIEDFISENLSEIGELIAEDRKNLEEKLALFDKKFVDTVVDKYEEIKLISNRYNDSFSNIEQSMNEILSEFSNTKSGIEEKLAELSDTILSSTSSTERQLGKLQDCFDNLKSQISNKSFDEAFQASINSQIGELETLIQEQFSYIQDISDLCCTNLPDVTEMNTLLKHSVLKSIEDFSEKLDSQDLENKLESCLKEVKSDIITQFLNVFNQISFVTEQEEILDFIQEKHSELITILSHIVTTSDTVENINENVIDIDNKIDSIKNDIDNINGKINSIISSEGDIDYVYSLQDLESDIANLRLVLNEMKDNNHGKEFSDLISSTNEIYKLVESIKSDIPSKKDIEDLAEDLVSISTRTNKLILSSDESYKTLQDNLQDFKLVINDLDERTKNFPQDAGIDKIDSKLNSINSMMVNGAKTNQVFNQIFEYLAEWVDNASVQINSISDKIETLDEIEQIKLMLTELKAGAEDDSQSAELVEALGNVFDKQTRRISSLEAKLDKIIVETTIISRNNKVDMTPLEDTLNKFLVAVDDKMTAQQDKINSLEAKLEGALDLLDANDTSKLTKKVGGMDRQIAKLNKSIEKIASHVVEK